MAWHCVPRPARSPSWAGVQERARTGGEPVSRSVVWWLMARAAAGGSAVVLATTYLDEAQRAAVVLFLDGGGELASGTPEEIVAAVPGSLRTATARPDGEAASRAWRRGGRWRGLGPRPRGAARAGQPRLSSPPARGLPRP